MRRRRSSSPLRIESLAGWVFADLLLVLFVVGLGTQVMQIANAEEVSTPEPEVVIGMKQEPVIVNLRADADALLSGTRSEKMKEEKRLRRQIKDRTEALADDQAAMTLIWGCGPSADVGQPVARAAGRQLDKARPKVFGKAPERPLWDGSCKKGGIELEIYLYTTKPATG